MLVNTTRDIRVRGLQLCGLTWSGEYLWYSEASSQRICAIDPVSGTAVRTVPCAGVRTDLTTLGGKLLQVATAERVLRVVDPATGHLEYDIANPRPGRKLCGLEATGDGLWLGYEDLLQVELRNREGALLHTIPVSRPVAGLTVTDRFLLYADHAGATLTVVDIDSGRELVTYSVVGNPAGLTWDGEWVWYCDHRDLRLCAVALPGLVQGS
ncbi:PQQ-binding-like beta-propeller repeat protein [Winogradskya humida]